MFFSYSNPSPISLLTVPQNQKQKITRAAGENSETLEPLGNAGGNIEQGSLWGKHGSCSGNNMQDREMARSVQCPLNKHEDLHLTQNPHKKMDVMTHCCNPSTGEVDGKSLGLTE